ncbi:unnamed protein product [Nesidiocoris tenuis]|uniref:GTP-binding protein Di-Ras2 n=1 Tax=Nesidiocoris tenuis TaxID=355587 RepID=A0A6H5G4C6_9HEMI|nr:unnamed protein product [Nesidiocoris tenuis]
MMRRRMMRRMMMRRRMMRRRRMRRRMMRRRMMRRRMMKRRKARKRRERVTQYKFLTLDCTPISKYTELHPSQRTRVVSIYNDTDIIPEFHRLEKDFIALTLSANLSSFRVAGVRLSSFAILMRGAGLFSSLGNRRSFKRRDQTVRKGRSFFFHWFCQQVDILDTCGDLQFPAMRRLSIATAHAFLLVYSITSEESFNAVKRCFEEVREQRPDFQEVPIVVAGNKVDLADVKREVQLEDVSEWLYCTLPRLRANISKTKLMECSAKAGTNVQELFKSFVTLAKIMPTNTDETPLKRRYSGDAKRSSAYGRRGATSGASGSSSPSAGAGGASLAAASPKPRSRSLIRRCSRKTKAHLNETNESDCIIS